MRLTPMKPGPPARGLAGFSLPMRPAMVRGRSKNRACDRLQLGLFGETEAGNAGRCGSPRILLAALAQNLANRDLWRVRYEV